MRIAIYNSKGGVGKTSIAANTALEKGFCIGTNETYHVYDNLIADNQLIAINTEDEFPDVGSVDIVFDLAGSISKNAHSITSALKMSDWVVVPIYNEFKSLVAGLNTIKQIQEYNSNIIVIANKLKKNKKDIFVDNNWQESEDYLNVAKAIADKISGDIPVLALKESKALDNIFEEGKSIKQLMSENALAKYSYKEVQRQFEKLYKAMEI